MGGGGGGQGVAIIGGLEPFVIFNNKTGQSESDFNLNGTIECLLCFSNTKRKFSQN